MLTANSFNAAFPSNKPRRVQNAQHCTAASGNKMNSLGIYEIELEIKGRKYRHHINVIDQLTDNIIGIDFMHQHQLHYDVQTRQVKIAGVDIDQIVAIKEQTLPALASTVITAKYKGKNIPDANFIANIYSPRTPMVSGMPSIVSIDKNNNCKIVVDNCAPYDVTINRGDILGIMDIETDKLIPMEDSTISAILQDIDKTLPKVPKKKLSREEIANKAHLNVPDQFKQRYIDILFKHQKTISINKYDLGLAKSFQHKIHLKDNFDKKALPHEFKINDLVLYEDFSPLGKNAKLTPKWLGPAKITEINDTNARIQLPNGKSKILNIMRIKKFFHQKRDKQWKRTK